MSAALSNPALVQNNNLICLANRADSVGYDDFCHAGKFCENSLNLLLGFCIQCRCGIVQNKHRSLSRQGTCNCNSLLLSATKANAALTNYGVFFFFHFVYKLRSVRLIQSRANFCGCNALAGTKSDVSVNRVAEQKDVLHNTRDSPSQGRQRQFADINSIKLYASVCNVVHALKQIDDCRLTRTG